MNTEKGDRSVVVIGGGLGGLAAACTLAGRGHHVTLLERNAWLGGKAAVLERDGFRFDMGPTILTLPSVLVRIFAETGRNMADYLELIRLDPQWRCFFQDGSVLDLQADCQGMKATLDAYSPGSSSGDRYDQFLQVSRHLREISEKFFFWRSIGSIRDMMRAGSAFSASTLMDVLALRMGSSVARTVRSYAPNKNIAQMLDHFTQYVGSAPDQSPAVLCGIAHMQTTDGVWYPMGGTAAIPRALERLARELGVTIRTGVQVIGINQREGHVTGVTLESGNTIDSDAVVSNMDVVRTFRELVGGPPARSFDRRRKFEPACSGVVVYLGLNRAYDHLLHHNFVFSRDPREEFEAIYRRGEPAPDPTCYVCAPARTESGVAPAGGEALYVLVHMPYLRPHHDWKEMLPEYRKIIIEKLKSTAGMEDIERRIVVEEVLTPQDINDRYQVLNGAIYGLASHGRFFGAFKPGNRNQDVKGLYLAGGSAHPGPGMPMVLMSGWIAADTADQDLSEVAGAA